MNKKILALDLDDTLLMSDKSISEENLNAMNEMLKKGHIITIDSGRPIFGMKPVTGRYDIFQKENVYLLGIQGGLGYYPFEDRLLFINYLEPDSAVKLVENIKDSGLCFLGFDTKCIYAFERNEIVERYNRHSLSEIRIITEAKELLDINLCKVMAISYDEPEKLLPFKEKMDASFGNCFESMFSSVYFLEFIKKGTSKAYGLENLAKSLNIPIEDTVACGDERNDISMIKAAGVGVCVANGSDEAKAVADYVTVADHDHGAIAEVINKFIL